MGGWNHKAPSVLSRLPSPLCSAGRAQAGQMQRLPRSAAAREASAAWSMWVCMHQQLATSDACVTAHRLASPHSGQTASGGRGGGAAKDGCNGEAGKVLMRASVGWTLLINFFRSPQDRSPARLSS